MKCEPPHVTNAVQRLRPNPPDEEGRQQRLDDVCSAQHQRFRLRGIPDQTAAELHGPHDGEDRRPPAV